MNNERDKFLTEAMGECWHEWDDIYYDVTSESGGSATCKLCNQYRSFCGYRPGGANNFSTWPGFGKLWEWSQKQEWAAEFLYKYFGYSACEDTYSTWVYKRVHPDRFADALYQFLKEKNL